MGCGKPMKYVIAVGDSNICSSRFGLMKGGLALGGSPRTQRISWRRHASQLHHGRYHEQRGSHKGMIFLYLWSLK